MSEPVRSPTSALVVNCNDGGDNETAVTNATNAASTTTTISTIAVQAGPARIVIALLKSKEELQLEILEMQPDLSRIGSSLEEAIENQRQHEEVLTKLQGKQSPVEELLNQADQLISTQKPKAEVYAAMAESLGLAWRDLNNQLEHRKQMLEQSVAFHQRAKEFSGRLDAGEKECKDIVLPTEADMLRALLQQHHDRKKSILEASMYTLNEGQLLLERLREVATRGTGDARPNYLRQSANSAVFQVEQFLESLHDRRSRFDEIWTKFKQTIEETLQQSLLYNDITHIKEWLQKKNIEISRMSNLGDSSSSAELQQHEWGKLQTETKQIQDRAIRLLRTAEQLTSAGHPAGTQSESKSYALLENCAEFADKVDSQIHLLEMAVAFFRSAQSAFTKLDQIDVQLATCDPSSSINSQLARTVDEVTIPSLQEGRALLKKASDKGIVIGSQGVQRTVTELEERKKRIETILDSRNQQVQKSDALKTYQTTFNNLYMWIVNNGENFLKGHREMGSVLAMAKEFLQRHEQLLKDVLNKGPELDAVFRSIPNLLKSAPDDVSEIDETMERLRTTWIEVNTHLESRIQLSRLYYNFHRLAVQLANDLDAFEDHLFALKDGSQSVTDTTASEIEEKWMGFQQSWLQMKNTGKNFISDAKRKKDPYLDIQRAILCVETLLEHFGNRISHLGHLRENYRMQATQNKENQVLWETNATNIRKSLQWISTIEVDLYPVVTGNVMNVQSIIWDLERKLDTFVPNIKKAHAELESQMKSFESLSLTGEPQMEKDNLTSELNSVSQRLHSSIMDYQILVNMLSAYFKKVLELEKMVEKLQIQYTCSVMPTDVNGVEVLFKEHEASKQAVLELFRFSANEKTPIVAKIREMEPEMAARHDQEKLGQVLDLIQQHWEKSWREHRQHLEQHLQLCQFNQDLKQINSQLQELSVQLANVRGNYGESLPAAKATSQAFIQFEKTIELLEQRIQIFTSTAQKMLSSNHTDSQHIRFEIQNLQNKWSTFHMQVSENRRLLNLSVEYFKLVEDADVFFKEGSKLLIQIARKSTSCRNPQEATDLLNEVDRFMSSGQIQQQERLSKISSLYIQLYGDFPGIKVNDASVKNKEMLDSFSVIKEELNTLSSNLKSNKVQHDKYLKEKEEVDAALVVAKAEAANAKAAAAASEEARKVAESAARATPLHVFERIHVKEIHHDREAVPLSTLDNSTPPQSPPVLINKIPRHVPPQFILPLEDAKILEGVQFKFQCRVTGFPTPNVKWFKDGIAILNNPDYKTSYDEETGVCTLTIEETFSEDSATFMCKAGNAAGIVETKGTLTVRDDRPVEELVPPEFVTALEPAVTKVGDSFKFECQVTGKPIPTVTWMKNDISIDNSPNYVITYNDGSCVLRFNHLVLDDVAKYTCRATNKAGVASSTANLIVQVAEQLESPVFTQPLSNVMARAGQKLRLECCIHGLPRPEITWLHNNKPLKESRELRIQYDGEIATLVISEAFPKDAGNYVVVAKNRAGEATSSSTIMVKGRLPPETSDSELASDMEPVKPRILLELNDKTADEHNTIRMDCVIVGQPEPEVIWYHNCKPVKESNDYQLLFEGDQCSLIIREALTDDAGEYKVIAINSAGEASSRCQLTITNSSDSKNRGILFSVDKATPPKFTALPVDAMMSESESYLLECTITGEPSPVVTWFKDNRELQPSLQHKISRAPNGVLTLNIPRLIVGDSGTYTVKASNVAGDAKCFCNLSVVPKISTISENVKINGKPPVFEKLFTDQIVHTGETATFECVVTGSPKPNVQWYFEGKPITGKDFDIISLDDTHKLTMSTVTSENNGRFSCTADNDSGKSTCSAVLKVSEPCEIIIPYDDHEENDGEVEQSYKMTSVSKSTTMTQKSFSQKTTSVQSGGNVEFHQLATKEEHAMQKINDVPIQEVHSSKKEEIHRTNPSWAPLQISQSTKAMESTQNLSIENTAPQFSNAVQSTFKKPEAPKFIQTVMSCSVSAGDPVTFQGQIEGYPEPSVKWYKNSIEIFRSDFQTSFTDGIATLKLPKAISKDAGRYTCTARNTAGTASSSADLIVKSDQCAPQFIKSLQAQVVQKGQRVEMDVQVSGIPEPEVTFYKNAHLIGGTGRCRLKTNGNKSVLVIPEATPEDSGKYMVKAVNPGGEAHSVADFLVEQDDIFGHPKTVTSKHITTVYEEKKQTMSQISSSGPEMVIDSTKPNEKPIAIESKLENQNLTQFSAPSSKLWTQTKTPPEKASIGLPLQEETKVDYPRPISTDSDNSIRRENRPKVPPPPPPKPKSSRFSPKSPSVSETEDELFKRMSDFKNRQSPQRPSCPTSSTPPPSKIPIQSTFRSPSQSPSRDNDVKSPETSWRPVTTTWRPVISPAVSPITPDGQGLHKTAYKKSTEYEEVQIKRTRMVSTPQPSTLHIGNYSLEPGPPPEFGYVDPKTVHHRSYKMSNQDGVEKPSLVTPIFATEFPKTTTVEHRQIELKPGTPPEIGYVPASGLKSETTPRKAVSRVWTPTSSQSAPVFVKPLQDKQVEIGEQVTFDCIVLGDPTPRIQWLRDGRTIPNADESTHQYNMCLLTIPAAQSNDEGTITCVATNPAGSATTSAALKIADDGKAKVTQMTNNSPDSMETDQPQQTSSTVGHKRTSYVMSRINQFSNFK